MTQSTNPCGCDGTWVIQWQENADSGTYTTQGYETDTPYFTYSASIGKDILVSVCDGRQMQFPWWSSNIGKSQVIGRTFSKTDPNCTTPSPSTKYDCINGNCIPSTTYNTPGLYTSLADCQAVCANGGACGSGKQCVDPTTFIPSGKVCMDQGEFDSIEALISKIGSEVC